MEEENEQFERFRFRLKAVGQISNHDLYWKEIFEDYDLKWEEWWENYCQGYHNLTGHFTDDILTEEEKKEGFRSRYFGSIFSQEIENLFIKWLYYGKKKDLLPFYNWFKRFMERERKERIKQQKLEELEEKGIEKERPGYIYILKSKNLYKIGRASNLKERMKTYKTENPFGIRVILQKKVDDYVEVEAKLLKEFKEKQVRGEWFKLDKEDLIKIKEILNQ